jgi:cytoskeletal protein CcmA (bactofilin family)
MNTAAQIGTSIHIKGEVTASEPLTIAGHVDGSVQVEGHPLTIAEGGHVRANLVAHTIVVSGSVHGNLNASARISITKTATVEGDLSAPAVGLAEGATLHGRIETAVRQRAVLQLAS